MSTKTIDFLFEDPPISGQKYALVTIVGPHMKQKCDVWGLKVRGFADTNEKAKLMAQKLMRIDNNYDVYTVDVGKFFPLAVEPHEVGDIQYQNNQLNDLIKSYLENKESANEHWSQRKNDMLNEAIREGKNQEELANKPEHPISVLQRIRNYEESVKNNRENLEALEMDLKLSKEKFEKYTDEERELANTELKNAVENNIEPNIPQEADLSVDEIRNQVLQDLDATQSTVPQEKSEVEKIISELKANEEELEESKSFRDNIDASTSPHVHSRLCKSIDTLEESIRTLTAKLQNSNLVNDFINSSYSGSQYDYLTGPSPNQQK
jgi:hypothetical protein